MTAQPSIPAAGTADGAVHTDAYRWLLPAVETAALVSGNWPLTPEPAPWQWTCFPRVAIRTPAPKAVAVREARDFAIATMRRWGAEERSADVAIVVSELLTNALRHALPGSTQARPCRVIRLALVQPGPCVLCAVADPSPRPPVPSQPSCLAETGRGLHVVSALSENWGYTTLGDPGKIVWAILATTRPPH